MKKQRKHYTPEEKVAILRRHLVEGVPISDVCEERGLQPTVFYRWQKEFFENGAADFQATERPHRPVKEKQKRIGVLEKKVQTGLMRCSRATAEGANSRWPKAGALPHFRPTSSPNLPSHETQ